jgi:hypothetical protein
MATSYTSDKKIGALDPITGTLDPNDEFVVNKNGDTLKTSVAQVEEAMFNTKTSGGTPQLNDVVVIRRGSLIRQLETQNLIPDGAITKEKIVAAAGIEDSKLAKITTAGKVGGGAITDGTIAGSTAVNTSGAIATSSTLAAGNTTITGNATVSGTLGVSGVLTATGGVSGNVDTATTLRTARTIAISGDVTGTATSFNGSANITIPAAITADSIVNADINSAAGITDGKLATIATAGKVSNSATTATSANTANAIVARDASGNFTAGTVTAALNGNANTATLATKASTLSQGGANGTAMTFFWSGQGGQPNWLWGGNDGSSHYVYNPSNFSVNYANSAGTASTVSDGAITTAKIANGNVTRAKLVNVIESGTFNSSAVGTPTASNGWTVNRIGTGRYKLYKAGFDYSAGGYSTAIATVEVTLSGMGGLTGKPRYAVTERWADGPYIGIYNGSGALTDDFNLLHFVIT